MGKFSASGLSEGSNIKMLNGGGLWSHEDLGVADVETSHVLTIALTAPRTKELLRTAMQQSLP